MPISLLQFYSNSINSDKYSAGYARNIHNRHLGPYVKCLFCSSLTEVVTCLLIWWSSPVLHFMRMFSVVLDLLYAGWPIDSKIFANFHFKPSLPHCRQTMNISVRSRHHMTLASSNQAAVCVSFSRFLSSFLVDGSCLLTRQRNVWCSALTFLVRLW
jgi:hypothetical protein